MFSNSTSGVAKVPCAPGKIHWQISFSAIMALFLLMTEAAQTFNTDYTKILGSK